MGNRIAPETSDHGSDPKEDWRTTGLAEAQRTSRPPPSLTVLGQGDGRCKIKKL